MSKILRLGSVPYLNAQPLCQGLQDLFLAAPAALFHAVKSKHLDLALLPVVAHLEAPELKILPGLGIVSRGSVLSVRLFHRYAGLNLSNTESIYLDPDSKTSQRLLKVLLQQKYQRPLDRILWCDRPENADSVLQIGDPALQRIHHPYYDDLGQEWQALTGLPFVYACWMSNQKLSPEIKASIVEARDCSTKTLQRIASTQKNLDAELAYRYLSHHIFYEVGASELIGLQLFFNWVKELEEENYDTALRFVA